MARYDKNKDVELFQTDIDGLQISVWQYNVGEPKLQIGPRTYKKKDGSLVIRKAGRLTFVETRFLLEKLPDMLDKMYQ